VGWKKGETKVGVRKRLALNEKFLDDLWTVYCETGIGAIRSFRQEDPVRFCIMLAGLLPKEMSLSVEDNRLADISDEELETIIDEIRTRREALAGFRATERREETSTH
jgi:hypothetical protein